jgi:hypothetical protein
VWSKFDASKNTEFLNIIYSHSTKQKKLYLIASLDKQQSKQYKAKNMDSDIKKSFRNISNKVMRLYFMLIFAFNLVFKILFIPTCSIFFLNKTTNQITLHDSTFSLFLAWSTWMIWLFFFVGLFHCHWLIPSRYPESFSLLYNTCWSLYEL